MKKVLRIVLLFFSIHFSAFTCCQEIPVNTEQQLENLPGNSEGETEDDSYLQELEQFRKHPIDLNSADAEELEQLRILSALQINNFISYRHLFGRLLTIYELQAVPSWDILTIRRLLPFITVGNTFFLKEQIRERFTKGDHSLLLRVSQILERSKAYDRLSTGTNYAGSPQRIFFRYRYSYKNIVQFGLVGDKDAGEPFFNGVQKAGFDFYSFHFFARKMGSIQALAIGDFTVNMGQGLIQWQGLAFKKSAEVMGIKRQSAVLRPYNSAGEFYFHRGVGITVKKANTELTLFASLRKLSANFVTDTSNQAEYISSFLTSGYHRSANEMIDRNNLLQTSFGGNIVYRSGRWHAGLNSIAYQFSLPLQKRSEPYNLYAINGRSWHSFSVDYSYTWKNLHVFGEAAMDKDLSKAFINGLLISVDPRVDLSFVHRKIEAAYQAINGNAFTENTYPTNETGFYAGISVRPFAGWKFDAYTDVFTFPWLKYQVDAPSHGTDLLAQLVYTPNKQVEIYTRFRNESKQINQPGNVTETNYLVKIPRQNWRVQVNYKLNNSISLRTRAELLWYDKKGLNEESGFSAFADVLYKPLLRPYSVIIRLQYFETDGYNARLYAYENDVLYNYSIPALFDKGLRYYISLNYDLSKKLSFWARWAQTIYSGKSAVGSGQDETEGNKRTELKLQVRWLF